ncbi:MAG: hypothetical protein RR054_01425 [Clostridia bacterium]
MQPQQHNHYTKSLLGKRIMIIGCAGSGKTTMSVTLSKIVGINAIHLDKYYWKPDWQESDKSDWESFIASAAAKDEWIIDGNYRNTMELRLQRADSVIFLDLPRSTCLISVLKRVFKYKGKQRFDMGNGCLERFDFSFIKWVYNFKKDSKPKILKLLDKHPDIIQITLHSRKEIQSFLLEIDK